MKKTILSILLAGMLCQLVSCGTESVPEETAAGTDTQAAEAETVLSAADLREAVSDSLPADLQFGGADVNIYVRDVAPFNTEMHVEETNGEVVNDAIYNRNRTVEERLNVILGSTAKGGDHDVETVTNAVLASDDIFTIVTGSSFRLPGLALEGYLYNLNDMDYLDFGQPWWVSSLRDKVDQYGQLYFMSGDIALSLYQLEKCVFVNLALMDRFGMEQNLHEIVKNGEWTLDVLSEMASQAVVDVNGDGVMNLSDSFGLAVVDSTSLFAMGVAGGLEIVHTNDEGKLVLALGEPHVYDLYDKVTGLLWNNQVSVTRHNGSFDGGVDEAAAILSLQQLFMEDRLLFNTGSLIDAETLRDMESDYDILPLPKYDTAQADYRSISHDKHTVVAIPVTCSDLALAGGVCEAMAAESYRTVIPAYLDVALKDKYSRDAETAEMIDMVLASVTFDFGLFYSHTMNYASHTFQNAIEGSMPYASRLAEREQSIQSGLDTILAYYEEHAE